MMTDIKRLVSFLSLIFLTSAAYAGTPLWTFTPLTPTTFTITANDTVTVQYTVTNQSRRTHTLVLTPQIGVTQVTTAGNCPNPFVLGFQQSCTLTLSIDGSAIRRNITTGPVVCERGNPLQCYQPCANKLNISLFALYGVTGEQGDNPESLFTLNTATGFATLVMPLGNGDDGEAIASDGLSLYHWSGLSTQVFERIDLATLTTINIPVTGDPYGEVSGAVYYSAQGGFIASDLSDDLSRFTISGNVTALGLIGFEVKGLACLTHRVWAVAVFAPLLFELDPFTGAILSTTPVTLPGFVVLGGNGLTVNPTTGVFYALLRVVGSTPRKLVTIDINTGVATLIGNADDGSGTSRFAAIAFHPADPTC